MEEELTCAVCNEIYKEPMLLGCGHSYCKVCLDNIVRNASVNGEVAKCPSGCGAMPSSHKSHQSLGRCNSKLKNIVKKYHQQQQQRQQKKQLEERTLGQEICGMHQGHRAYLYCKKCRTAACPLCLCDDGIGQHVGHVVITLEDWCSGLKKEAMQVEDQGEELVQTVDDIISDVTKGGEDIEKLRTEYGNTVAKDYKSVIKILEDWHNEALQAMSRDAVVVPFPQGLHQHRQDIRKLCDSAKSLDFPLSLREIAAGVTKLDELKLRMCNFKTCVDLSKTQKDLALTNLTADLEDFFRTQVRSFNKEANGCIKAFEQVMELSQHGEEELIVISRSKLDATVQQFEETDARANMLSEKVMSLESQVADLGSKLEATVQQFEEADTRANRLSEQVTSLESQVAEIQDTMNEETLQKLAAQSTLRHAEETMKLTQDQLSAEEEQRRAMEQKVNTLTTQLVDMKKKLESAACLVKGYEESKKNVVRDIEVLQVRSEQLLVVNDQLNKFKTKLQSQIVDMKKKLESAAGLVNGYEESKKNMQREIGFLQMRSEQLLAENGKVNNFYKKLLSEMIDMKKSAAGMFKEYDESKKKMQKEIEILQMHSEQLLAENNKLNTFNGKLQSQVEDSNVEIETLRQQLWALENRQKTLEQNLREEKATSDRLAMERDNAERDSRQKETTIINLTLELDELRDRLEEVERLRITQARELDELTLDVCKSTFRTDYGNTIATVIKTLEQYQFPLSVREITAGVAQLEERKLRMCHFKTQVEAVEQEGMEHVMGSGRSRVVARSHRLEEELISLVDNFNGKIKNLRSRIGALEERHKKSDQNLGEEKAISRRLSMERDNANRESQEKETKILNQTRELDELRDRLEEVERLRTTHRDLISSKDDAGKRECPTQ